MSRLKEFGRLLQRATFISYERFLDNHYRANIKDLAELGKPLTDLTARKSTFET